MELKIHFSSCTCHLVLQDLLKAHSQAALGLTELARIQLNEMAVSMDLPLYHKTSHASDFSAFSDIFLLFSTAHVQQCNGNC